MCSSRSLMLNRPRPPFFLPRFFGERRVHADAVVLDDDLYLVRAAVDAYVHRLGLRVLYDVYKHLARHTVEDYTDRVVGGIFLRTTTGRDIPFYSARYQQLVSERLKRRRYADFEKYRRTELKNELSAFCYHLFRRFYRIIDDLPRLAVALIYFLELRRSSISARSEWPMLSCRSVAISRRVVSSLIVSCVASSRSFDWYSISFFCFSLSSSSDFLSSVLSRKIVEARSPGSGKAIASRYLSV